MQWLPAAKNRFAWRDIKGLAFFEDQEFISTGPGVFIERPGCSAAAFPPSPAVVKV